MKKSSNMQGMSKAYEINFDGLVGPTHNYAGLSYGNVASQKNRNLVANPREAALQGLEKMKYLADLGLKQAVLPPQQRPDMTVLRRLGYAGTDAEVLARVAREEPPVLASVYSASSMWTANAATVSPSADTADGKVHFTPANLQNNFHRSLEPDTTARILKAIFAEPSVFAHHAPLPASPAFGDEGAANHTRFCTDYGTPGVEFFVYGKHAFDISRTHPKKFPARQTLEASQAVVRLHGLSAERVVFAQQNPEAIDAGVFHNDVTAVGNGTVLFCHETSFLDQAGTLKRLREVVQRELHTELTVLEVPSSAVSLTEAVQSYLFNTQLLTLPAGPMTLLAPLECSETPAVKRYLDELLARTDHPVRSVQYVDVRQSMRNGGGPACLRLRVALTQKEMTCANPAVFLDDTLYGRLQGWIRKHYRDRLSADDLVDALLVREVQSALDELTHILKLGSVYPFQRASS